MPLVIMMRHGKTTHNVKRLLAGRVIESHLTEEGIGRVKNIAKKLRDANIRYVYTSPLSRCKETAEIVCKELSLDYIIDDRLIEVDMGKITGLMYNEVISIYGNIFSKFYNDDPIIDELSIERFSTIRKRVDSILKEIAMKDENILLITHLDPIKAAIANILRINGNALYKLVIPNASLTILKHGSSEYNILAINVMDIDGYLNL
jgi:probable phosphoglycerate mutase